MARKYIQNCTGDNCQEKSVKFQRAPRITFYFLLIIFFGVAVWILLFSPYLQISNVTIVGNAEITNQQILQTIDGSIEGKYLNLIPKSNFYLVSAGRIEGLLQNTYRKIRSVKVEKKFPDMLSISIEERKALLVWCSGDSCFLVDENGVAYAQADFNSPELVQNNLLRINDKSGASIAVGEDIISSDYAQYILNLKQNIIGIGLDTTEEYWTPSRMSEEIDTKTSQGTELYFSTQFDVNEATHALQVILKKEISDSDKSNLAYVDLRTENKVFYKLNGSQQQQSDQQTDQNTPLNKEKK